VAKGLDLVAQNIKRIATENGVPLMEDRPLARALYAAAEIGQVIPRDHFEAVAKIIGLIWAQKGKLAPQGAR
jgi:flagellar biosynthesis protein FlhB